jgi:hypothetical protein
MLEGIGNTLIQILVAIIGAAAGVVITAWFEKGKRRILEDKNATLEDEIRDVANQPEVREEPSVGEDVEDDDVGDVGDETATEIEPIAEERLVQTARLPGSQKAKMTGWTWREVMPMLSDQLPAGSVTTHSLLSLRLYRRRRGGPIRAMLAGARKNGHEVLSNRIVADFPKPSESQRIQLEMEGIPFTADGKVDWTKIKPVVFT